MRRLKAVMVLYGLFALAGGCASAPSRFYTLGPSPLTSPGTTMAGLVIAVGPVTVPEVVDRPQMVLRAGPNRVVLDELNRWASSLQDEIGRAVVQNLATRFGGSAVTLSSQPSVPDAACRVTIAVQRFESTLGDSATLDALWTVRRAGDKATRTGRTTHTESARGAGHDALVAAHSRAVGRLSEDIAEAVASMATAARGTGKVKAAGLEGVTNRGGSWPL